MNIACRGLQRENQSARNQLLFLRTTGSGSAATKRPEHGCHKLPCQSLFLVDLS
jgi:hypothetical protein